MIKGLLLVSFSGGLVYSKIHESLEAPDIDKVIAMASTVYTALEILSEARMVPASSKYENMRLIFERGVLSVFRAASKLIFIVIHTSMPEKDLQLFIEQVHRRYIEEVLYDPLYSPGERIPASSFDGII